MASEVPGTKQQASFRIVSEGVKYARYLTLYERTVKFESPCGTQSTEHTYDVVGHPHAEFMFAVVFPFHSPRNGAKSGEVTLIREYAQGPNQYVYCLPTGGFDPERHENIDGCAKAELSEEALLCGGQMVRLVPAGHPGLAEVKWCRNRFVPYLVVDPQLDMHPGSRDPEELIEVKRVSISELRALATSGDMLLPSVTTTFLALDRLAEMGLV